ncbi:MAG TPA: ATP-binding cassette domain-containing protein [Solirubrobacteraceae bacterium]|jgi:ABC-2 type transport system ATP-binding protein
MRDALAFRVWLIFLGVQGAIAGLALAIGEPAHETHVQALGLLIGVFVGAIWFFVHRVRSVRSRMLWTVSGLRQAGRVQAVLLLAVAVIAIVEEVVWRGVVFTLTSRSFGLVLGIAISSLFFGFAHVSLQRGRAAFRHGMTGATFASVYIATQSLGAAVLAHCAWNSLTVLERHGSRVGASHPGGLGSQSDSRASTANRLSGRSHAVPFAELQDASKRFSGVSALLSVSFKLNPGEIVGLIGPNGAGKTTALTALVGLLDLDTGRARLFDEDPRSCQARRRLGIAWNETDFPPAMSVLEIIEFVAAHFPTAEDVGELLRRFGLADCADRRPIKLSTGQRRRLAVALAFVGYPSLLILDEPTANLDRAGRQEVWRAMREASSRGAAVVFTTQHLYEAQALADRIIVVVEGQLVTQSSPRTLVSTLSREISIRPLKTALPPLTAIDRVEETQSNTILHVKNPDEAIRQLVQAGVPFQGLTTLPPNLEELTRDDGNNGRSG